MTKKNDRRVYNLREVNAELEVSRHDLQHARMRRKELSGRWEACPEEKRGLLAEFIERLDEDIAWHEDRIAELENARLGREA